MYQRLCVRRGTSVFWLGSHAPATTAEPLACLAECPACNGLLHTCRHVHAGLAGVPPACPSVPPTLIYHTHPPSPCREIPDEDAKKPEGWLDDEPAEIDDPGGWPRAAVRPSSAHVLAGAVAAGDWGMQHVCGPCC